MSSNRVLLYDLIFAMLVSTQQSSLGIVETIGPSTRNLRDQKSQSDCLPRVLMRFEVRRFHLRSTHPYSSSHHIWFVQHAIRRTSQRHSCYWSQQDHVVVLRFERYPKTWRCWRFSNAMLLDSHNHFDLVHDQISARDIEQGCSILDRIPTDFLSTKTTTTTRIETTRVPNDQNFDKHNEITGYLWRPTSNATSPSSPSQSRYILKSSLYRFVFRSGSNSIDCYVSREWILSVLKRCECEFSVNE